jgi:xanthine dehydrogenase accessory factor
MSEIVRDLLDAVASERPCVLCEVVETRGSTPQKAGATMLVFPDGSQRGTLGGGCVEAEVKQRALRSLQPSAAAIDVMTFSLDDNYGWDDGLICGGRMTIIAERIDATRPRSSAYFRQLHALVQLGDGCTRMVVYHPNSDSSIPAGARFLLDPTGKAVARTDDSESSIDELLRFVEPIQTRPGAAVHRGVAYLPILPRVTLLIVGGGHVGQAVARYATDLDFPVWVLDDREAYANRERFPTASRWLVGDIGATLRELAPSLHPSTFCLIVTRGHAHDEEALYHLAPSNAGYVGMIGSKRKIRLIFEDLLAKGLSSRQLAKVHAPLGLSIGSQTVPEIAVSILAELIACRNLGQTLPHARLWVDVPGEIPRGQGVAQSG